MTFRIEFDPVAKAELLDACDWYESQQPGLRRRFEKVITLHVNRLKTFPGKHQIVEGKIRKLVIKGFPYIVLYEIRERSVVVLSVFHTSRDPNDWKKRLK